MATERKGIAELAGAIIKFLDAQKGLPEKRLYLLTDKCWQLIQAKRMKDLDKNRLKTALEAALKKDDFNLYAFTKQFWNKNVIG